MSDTGRGLAVLGGTFDPIHNGHLASAEAVAALLNVDQVVLVPSAMPPHKTAFTTAEQRLAMLELAVADMPSVSVDSRELLRGGVSYTFDTLASFRAEIGARLPLYFVLGVDAYATLNSWHRWQELTDLAHLIVLERPPSSFSAQTAEVPGDVLNWAQSRYEKNIEVMCKQPAGSIYRTCLVQVDLSATTLRQSFHAGLRPTGKMPENTIDYVMQHRLYR